MNSIKKQPKTEVMKTMSYVGVIALFTAILPLPSIYYLLLRQVITFIASYFVFRFYRNKLLTQAVISLGIAIIFNPFFPVYMDKLIWIIFDALAAMILLFLGTRQTAKITDPDELQAFFILYLIGSLIVLSLIRIINDPCDKLTGSARQECEARQAYDDYMESKDPIFP